MRLVLIAAVIASLGVAAQANIPGLNATCPGGIDVHADAGGPVYINGKQAKLTVYNKKSYDATVGKTTVSININPDRSLEILYTGKGGANGICKLVKHHFDGGCPVDVSEADRANYPACN